MEESVRARVERWISIISYSATTIAIGALTTIQAASNTALAEEVKNDVFATMMNSLVAFSFLAAMIVFIPCWKVLRESSKTGQQRQEMAEGTGMNETLLEMSSLDGGDVVPQESSDQPHHDMQHQHHQKLEDGEEPEEGKEEEGGAKTVDTATKIRRVCRRIFAEMEPAVIWRDARLREAPLWAFAGGICGVVVIYIGIVVSILVGFSLTFTTRACGKLLTSAVLDHYGLIGYQKRPVTFVSGFGLVLVLVGVSVALFMAESTNSKLEHKLAHSRELGGDELVFYAIISVVSGSLLPLQSASNNALQPFMTTGRLATVTVTSIRCSFLSFFTGFLFIFAIFLITLAANTHKHIESNGSWYHYFSGIIAAAYVTAAVMLPQKIGVAVFFVMTVCGQMIGSLLVDALGIFTAARSLDVYDIVGVICVIIGAVLVDMTKRKT